MFDRVQTLDHTDPELWQAQGSRLTNKYAEGYPRVRSQVSALTGRFPVYSPAAA